MTNSLRPLKPLTEQFHAICESAKETDDGNHLTDSHKAVALILFVCGYADCLDDIRIAANFGPTIGNALMLARDEEVRALLFKIEEFNSQELAKEVLAKAAAKRSRR